jgi:hypothetical protein
LSTLALKPPLANTSISPSSSPLQLILKPSKSFKIAVTIIAGGESIVISSFSIVHPLLSVTISLYVPSPKPD